MSGNEDFFEEEEDKLRDECGVAGIWLAPKKTEDSQDGEKKYVAYSASDFNAATRCYYALYALQHRGQDSAGIAVSNGETISIHKGLGAVSDVFRTENLSSLKGHIACGHVRYATSGSQSLENAQPLLQSTKLGSVAVAHNGQLVNYEQLHEMLEDAGCTFSSTSDTEVIVKLIAKSYKKGLEHALTDTIQMIKGSFALVVSTEKCLIGARDPNGIRPLCLGRVDSGWILASETCAIDAVNGTYVRDIQPGEIVIINEDGVLSFEFGERTSKRTCIFEYVYFARPDSIIDGIAVTEAREKMGACLARETSVPADVVIGVPDSGIGAAQGYAKEAGIPFASGIIKNKYIGRTLHRHSVNVRTWFS